MLAEKRLTGICLDLCEYDWDPGAEIVCEESEIVLKLRLEPHRLRTVAIIDGEPGRVFGPMLVRQPHRINRSRAGNVGERALVLNCRFDPDWVQSVFGPQDR
jgi:hypothetical protein